MKTINYQMDAVGWYENISNSFLTRKGFTIL